MDDGWVMRVLARVEEAFLRRRVDFARTTNTLVDSLAAASGVRTRSEFADIEATHRRLQELRDLGLRTEQIWYAVAVMLIDVHRLYALLMKIACGL
jgi:hypothetical protein